VVAALALATGCASEPPAAAGGRVAVVAGVNVWGALAATVGGDHVAVTSLISSPTADPHLFDAGTADALAVARARLVVTNGLGYDDFVGQLLGATGTHPAQVVAATVAGTAGSDANPHLWYDPSVVDAMARAIAAQLSVLDPRHAADYQAGAARAVSEEQAVVSVIGALRERDAGRPVGYTERVPGYLLAAAGLRVASPTAFTQAVESGTDPPPAAVEAYDQLVARHGIDVLLYNDQVVSPLTQSLRAQALAAGIPVVGVAETLPPGFADLATWQATQARALFAALGQ